MMEKKMVINMKAHSVLHVEMMKENQSSKSYGLHVIFVMHGITCVKVWDLFPQMTYTFALDVKSDYIIYFIFFVIYTQDWMIHGYTII